MPFAAALSEHPIPATAVGEVCGQVLERLGPEATIDLAVIFVTPAHAGALEDAAAVVRTVLQPATLIGCAAVAIAGTRREVEEGPGVSLWAASGIGSVTPLELSYEPTPDGAGLLGWPHPFPPGAAALLLIADPFTFDVEALIRRIEAEQPGVPVIGGMASAARGPGGNRLALDGRVRSSGAVGAVLGPQAGVTAVVSQGCRPIGHPYTVTRAEGSIIHELGGIAPLERLVDLARDGLPDEDVALINQGLHLGVVIDEHRDEFGRGDFLIRNVLGGDRQNGAIAVGGEIAVGTTVQYHVRDAGTADEDLRAMLAGQDAAGALLFTCNGRGQRLFGEPHHDATVLDDALDGAPVAGFFAAGELGPIGGRSFLHGFTASVALFHEEGRPRAGLGR
jgi:small ligand-binding sensory domain FIST